MAGIKGKNDDLYLSHSIINYLIAEIAGRYAFFSAAERLKVEGVGTNVLQATSNLMDRVDRWVDDLRKLQPLFSVDWVKPETFEAEEAISMLQGVQFDLDSLSVNLLALINDAENRNRPENMALAVAALARSVHARAHYMRGYVNFANDMQRADLIEHFSTGLELIKPEQEEVEQLIRRVEQGESIDPQELYFRTVPLPAVFRSHIHDITIMLSQFTGGLSFERAGFSDQEAVVWRESQVDVANAGYWRAFFFSVQEALAWSSARFTEPALAFEWRRYRFSPEEATQWNDKNIPPLRASIWKASGSNANEAFEWIIRGVMVPPEKPDTEAA